MNFLVIDGASDKIYFFSHFNNNSYNQSFESSKYNYEKFSILLFAFLNQNNINLSKISHLFVNQGPGSFSGIRTSIAVAKGKKQYDKRHTKKDRDWNREKARLFRKSS